MNTQGNVAGTGITFSPLSVGRASDLSISARALYPGGRNRRDSTLQTRLKSSPVRLMCVRIYLNYFLESLTE